MGSERLIDGSAPAMGGGPMLVKRVIPCLDIDGGRVVKHVQFHTGRWDAGDPVALAARYETQGADEIVILDISATPEGRRAGLDLLARAANEVFVPITVGGGMASLDDVRDALRAGADKVSLNSAAVRDPALVARAAEAFGSQCAVVAIDVRRSETGWEVYVGGGRIPTGLDALTWARTAERLGAGELLVTSIDADGERRGYDLALYRALADSVGIPVIASGGAGSADDMAEVLSLGRADAALAASIFHTGAVTVQAVKARLAERGVPVRW